MQFPSETKGITKYFCAHICQACSNMIRLSELHRITVIFKEFDEKLNVVAIHECTTEDIHKHLENAITEIFNQRQHAYLQGSASNIPS